MATSELLENTQCLRLNAQQKLSSEVIQFDSHSDFYTLSKCVLFHAIVFIESK